MFYLPNEITLPGPFPVSSWSLKVSKSRKQKYFFSILPKNEQKTFALVGRSNFDKYFVRFLGESKTSIFPFEIHWPLALGNIGCQDSKGVIKIK